MCELKHENIVPFFGVCTEPPNICIVTQYCKKGSLKVSNNITSLSGFIRQPAENLTHLSPIYPCMVPFVVSPKVLDYLRLLPGICQEYEWICQLLVPFPLGGNWMNSICSTMTALCLNPTPSDKWLSVSFVSGKRGVGRIQDCILSPHGVRLHSFLQRFPLKCHLPLLSLVPGRKTWVTVRDHLSCSMWGA